MLRGAGSCCPVPSCLIRALGASWLVPPGATSPKGVRPRAGHRTRFVPSATSGWASCRNPTEQRSGPRAAPAYWSHRRWQRQHPGSALPNSDVPSGTAGVAGAETGAGVGSSSSSSRARSAVTTRWNVHDVHGFLNHRTLPAVPPTPRLRAIRRLACAACTETVQTHDSPLRGRIRQKRRCPSGAPITAWMITIRTRQPGPLPLRASGSR